MDIKNVVGYKVRCPICGSTNVRHYPEFSTDAYDIYRCNQHPVYFNVTEGNNSTSSSLHVKIECFIER